MIVDLGCGEHKRGDIGIDIYPWPGVDHIVNLGFQSIPLPDDCVDIVHAEDFLEHLPKVAHCIDRPGNWWPHYPHIFLFNDVWRILKPGGRFETLTPNVGQGVHGRLFHASVWNDETFDQFTPVGTDYRRGHMQKAGLYARFEIIEKEQRPMHLWVVYKAVK